MKKHPNRQTPKPSPNAKALTMFLMAFKSKDPKYKEELKRINKKWDMYQAGDLFEKTYLQEVETMLNTYGGYESVVEKTVQYYIDKTGAWAANGDDQYHQDAKAIADKILKEKKDA